VVNNGQIQEVVVLRNSPCGCSRHVADGIVGTAATEAVEESAMLLHHYPCLASMDIDTDYLDTLMHESGNIMKDSFRRSIREQVPAEYIRPAGHVAGGSE
jgi:thymidylate synthase